MPTIEGWWELETAYGDIWQLAWPSAGIQRIAGMGLPPAEYAAQKAPGQHGSSHLGYALNDRTIQLSLLWRGGSIECLRDRRKVDVYPHIGYLYAPFILRHKGLDGFIRELHDCWYAGGLERDSDAIDDIAKGETVAIQLLVRDPVWFDPTVRSYTVNTALLLTGDELIFDTPAGIAGPTTIFSTPNYLTFGSSSISVTLGAGQIATLGDWYTFPRIVVIGPANQFEIENITAGYTITFDYYIAAGETVTFDLRYGYKTVTNQIGTNLVGYVPATDDLANFCLWPVPLAALGRNTIRLFAGGVSSATRIAISWYDRYQGI
jgi:hypothetical protein